MKARYFKESLAKMDVAQAGLNIINLPTLVLHGTEDQLVPFLASEYIFNNISSEDKQFEVCITVLIEQISTKMK